ncbi:charged multivesicular body protein 4b-like [Kryptolebias marmoratus]|uniref:charged multivesicular body protein 4b-like n=1 Tax=Kryptolebias marmoratus TaxID=37003 RepID=UPI0018ACEF47|nr:charged multivesicular body protein 4b-like [Kryptolebias marmoratus]
MSLFVKILGSGEKVRKARQERKVDKLPEREELLNKKTEFLKKRIDQELLCAKKNCRKNRRAALQALRRKKWCEKHLNHVDCSSEAMRSAHEHACSEIINKVNDLMKEIMEEEEEEEEEAAASLISSVSQKVEFDERLKLKHLRFP